MMRVNPVKRTLAAGGVALGTMVFEFNSTGIARIAANAGAEFVVFDTEHTGWTVETVRGLMASARAADTVPLVRVPATEYHLLAGPLDVGAMGLMAPMVESADQARRLVASAKYPPQGRRGAAFGIAHDDYLAVDPGATMRRANDEVLLIAQIETAAGVAAADEIAAVERVLAACERHGKAAGRIATTVRDGHALLAQGFRALAYGGDLWLYGQSLKQGLDALREGGATRPP